MNHSRWYIKGNQIGDQFRARTSSTIHFKSQKSFQCFDEEELQSYLPLVSKKASLMQINEELIFNQELKFTQEQKQQEKREVEEFRTKKAQTMYKSFLDNDQDYFYYNNEEDEKANQKKTSK
eukprot:TRINITY_DN3500_c0_g2_i1.p1 TRINITY_DN3500_c0_g2~~TRINITY_DN3500_c0_g2_i1.p1  ORF type:complete len:122 (-),score=22.98 TRINITY_DN3500_c0_g2_i1:17-382(-)